MRSKIGLLWHQMLIQIVLIKYFLNKLISNKFTPLYLIIACSTCNDALAVTLTSLPSNHRSLSTSNLLVNQQEKKIAQESGQLVDENYQNQIGELLAPIGSDSEEPVLLDNKPNTPAQLTVFDSQTIQVDKIEVIGSTIFSPEQFKQIIQPYQGRSLTIEQLREVADAITTVYLKQGYINTRAILAEQTIDINKGIVTIRVLEGGIEKIEVEGTRRLNANYIRSRVQLGTGTPFNTTDLENQLRLLRLDPKLESIEASLRKGTKVGQSILIVRVVEANPFEGSVWVDNYSPPSIGSERMSFNLRHLNLTGNGDEISFTYRRSTTGGSNIFDIGYRFPLNPRNGTLELRTVIDRNRVTQAPFNVFDIEGESELYEIRFRQPLYRTPREEFALSLGFSYRDGQTFLGDEPLGFGFGPDQDGSTTLSVIKFEQEYLRRDLEGTWFLRSLLSLGTGWFDATINPDPIPDGRFFRWVGQVQRLQILSEDNFLIMGTEVQLTPNSLLPPQQFLLGGGQSLRGYRQNIRAGDNGVRFSVEDRITLHRDVDDDPALQLIPFFDMGYVWNNPDNPNTLPSQRFLAGIGLGLIVQPVTGLNLRLDYGIPLVDLDDRSNNAQDEGFYFNVRYQY
ncbi:ShlB/FhaC/HecB family hemolysin secretion/activation protein [Moorena bouillonii]|uniref:ShlB/FhaC/HecB family hemolysin secretion/activation protein n=3 Tax=Moorena TaxID=1155738 RepID=UPI001E51096B|nr:ShlB/FhaC/HecB family hemolysin secretion/activation protein [Moorena bouillonii]